jgi:type I restriction-modification system DNA methylase subunit
VSAAPDAVLELAERFDRNLDAYRSGRYNETQLRREFVDPLFEALGWDVNNTRGWAEAYKEVIHEDAVKVGGATKAPDYSFRVGGVRKFFVETKKPSVYIKKDIHPAFQLRRYAWSAKLPLSILTDFEEFAVYDTRVRPGKGDQASKARTLYLRYTDYAERWEEVAGIFSKTAILEGSFDKYAESNKRKRGTADVDDAFLEEIERWRDVLARNIALRNPELSQRELNFAVQRTIDRIIFLRIAEDRGIEEYGRLQALTNGANVYRRLTVLFERADERYNSGLFHFRPERGREETPDELTPGLTIDDKPLKAILGSLYYPESPYEFSVLPADILGQVYERFLGKVIRLTPGHRAVVEEKPEVRKAGGVYYTPTYIVDYIVRQTVGKLVQGLKPGPRGGVSKLRILDPACGSGSFLIGAYQFLLDWHRDQYAAEPEKYRDVLVEGPGGEWRLTTAERKRILLNNIYGVDIDAQAVETTKLSLLLKVLEGENEQTLERQMALFHERALPDLSENIKSGNSLIGPDFYEGKQLGLLDEEERWRINAFDWEAEFPEIMRGGGFDAVIGNPPYGASFSEQEKPYLREHFEALTGKYDSYGFFMEQGLDLLKNGGCLGYIVPHTWLTVIAAEGLRREILGRALITEIDRLPDAVFRDATVNTVLIFLMKEKDETERDRNEVQVLRFPVGEPIHSVTADDAQQLQFSQSAWAATKAAMFNINISQPEQEVIRKMKTNLPSMTELCEFSVGIQAYDSHTGQDRSIIKNRAYHADHEKDGTYRRELNGRDVSRYHHRWPGERWVSYGEWLAHPRQPKYFEGPRILVREITGSGVHSIYATYLTEEFINYKSILNVLLAPKSREEGYDERYVLGLLNSRLLSWYFPRASNKLVTNTFPRVSILDIKRFPVRLIDFSDPADRALHDRMVELVERMLALHEQKAGAKIASDEKLIQRRIDATDREIDRLVYELYGLSGEEVAVVEGTANAI